MVGLDADQVLEPSDEANTPADPQFPRQSNGRCYGYIEELGKAGQGIGILAKSSAAIR